MPATYALNMFGLSFATLTALLVWVILEHPEVMRTAARRLPQLIIESLPGRKPLNNSDLEEKEGDDVPMWWYLICCALSLFIAIVAVEFWDVELRWYGVLLALAVALVFYAPVRSIIPSPSTSHRR
jgi:hypothetical protein